MVRNSPPSISRAVIVFGVVVVVAGFILFYFFFFISNFGRLFLVSLTLARFENSIVGKRHFDAAVPLCTAMQRLSNLLRLTLFHVIFN